MTVHSALGRRGPAVATMAIGVAVTVGGSLLPWIRTGGVRRPSYELFDLVERLGFAPDGVAAAALRWWPLVPLLAVAAVVAAWWGWPRAGGAIGVAAALYAGGVGLAVHTAGSDVVDVAVGPTATAIGAAVLLVGSIACVTAPTGLAAPGRPAAPPADRS